MNILSLDLSTKSSGWAYFENGELKDHGCITSASTDLIKRIYIMRDGIAEILDKYSVGNTKTHRALMWLQAATAFLIHDNYSAIEIEYIYPSSWRAALGIKNGRGIKRTSLKEQDIEYVKEKYNISVNDDEADAICIGLSQYKEKDNNEINWA